MEESSVCYITLSFYLAACSAAISTVSNTPAAPLSIIKDYAWFSALNPVAYMKSGFHPKRCAYFRYQTSMSLQLARHIGKFKFGVMTANGIHKYFPPIETVSGSGLFVSDRTDANGLLAGQKLKPELIALDNNYPQQASLILGKIYNLPKLKGFPISSCVILPNNKTNTLLTYKILKRDFIFKASSLCPPKNYKKIAMDKKMFLTENQSGMLEEMGAN